MNELIEQWFAAKDAVSEAMDSEEAAYEFATRAALPENLRPAIASDIVEGAILWYPNFHDEEMGNDPETTPLWLMVDDVYSPSDPWKAYCANDGCRYGLDGAFVEK